MMRHFLVVSLVLFLLGCAGPSLRVGDESWRGRSNYAAQLGMVGEKEGGWGYTFNDFYPIDFGSGFDASSYIRTYQKNSTEKNWRVVIAGSDATSKITSESIEFSGGMKEQGEFTIIDINWGIVRDALALEANAGILQQIRSDGDRSRVVMGVALTKGYSKVSNAIVKGKGAVLIKGVKLGADLSSTETVTTSLSDGSVFAYRFMRPVWQKKGDDWEIVRFARDDFGFDKPLEHGETFSPPPSSRAVKASTRSAP